MGKLKDIRVSIEFGKKEVRCPLCDLYSELIYRDPLNEQFGIRCDNCSTYYFDYTLFEDFNDSEHIYLFSGYTRHYSPNGTGFGQFNSQWVEEIINEEKQYDNENRKIAELIFYYEQKISNLNQKCTFDVYPAIAYCEGTWDLFNVAHSAQKKGYLQLFDNELIQLTETGIRFSRNERKRITEERMKTGDRVRLGSEKKMQIDKTGDFSKVFIVHGHDGELKEKVARLLEKQGIEAIILSEKANGGKTIIEKFETFAENVAAAICLYTPDDEMADGSKRARQNVVFETGYFYGKIGRERTIIISSDNALNLSDLQGVVYVNKNIWQVDVLKELREIGYKVDMNKL